MTQRAGSFPDARTPPPARPGGGGTGPAARGRSPPTAVAGALLGLARLLLLEEGLDLLGHAVLALLGVELGPPLPRGGRGGSGSVPSFVAAVHLFRAVVLDLLLGVELGHGSGLASAVLLCCSMLGAACS
jgi:hypothetical protein